MKTRNVQKTGCYSLKIDISKAYDRLKWKFLEKMMSKLGFTDRLINLIMMSVTTVGYKVKINDSISDIFVPTRGLQQGDPLSPYLFLIVTEWLGTYLQKLQSENLIKGIRICQGAPIVTHLMFADDTIFFMKAILSNAWHLKNALITYEKLSGQRINFIKYEVVFSKNVDACCRKNICDVLEVTQVPHHNKYLGLPLWFG
ncbi:hypothetical protein QQ045_001249 [Rhodiola kirilowii]